jgi:hypothetical protein
VGATIEDAANRATGLLLPDGFNNILKILKKKERITVF